MTLFAEIQQVLERTYSSPGVDLEKCLIGGERSAQLAALCPGAEGLAEHARIYIRPAGADLRIAIYYHPSLIRCLEEEDPRESISHRNVSAFISFIEEITHGVHAALAFRSGWRRWDSEQFACALEAQALVDTYFLLVRFCRLLGGFPPQPDIRVWLCERLFADEAAGEMPDRLSKRYRHARKLARAFLDAVIPLAREERIRHIREFRRRGLSAKWRLVRRLSV